jgi:nucleotide-binding universal stress UspA family protein
MFPDMKVLIAVDDDTESHDAVEFARRVLPADATVIVLNVAQYAVTAAGTMGTFAMGSYGDAMLTAETQERLSQESEEAARRTVEEASKLLDSAEARVEHGDVGPTICQVAADEAVDLVVLGTHDRGRFGRLWFGSVSDHVMHEAPCSVLVVR